MSADVGAIGAGRPLAVIIPTFNREDDVLQTLASVLPQLAPDDEVIVVDDGSTDATVSRLSNQADPRVRVIAIRNSGPCVARNEGVRHARSDWVAFIDSDDRALEGWRDAFDGLRDDGVGLVSCGAVLSFDDGEEERRPRPLGPAFGNITGSYLAGTFAVKRTIFEMVGGYRSGLRYGENTDLVMRIGVTLIEQGEDAASTPSCLIRVAAKRREYDADRYYQAGTQLLLESRALLERDRQLLANYLAITGVAASRIGRRKEAVSLLWQAWGCELGNWRHPARLARALFAPGRSWGE